MTAKIVQWHYNFLLYLHNTKHHTLIEFANHELIKAFFSYTHNIKLSLDLYAYRDYKYTLVPCRNGTNTFNSLHVIIDYLSASQCST